MEEILLKNRDPLLWYNKEVIKLMTKRERGDIDVLEFRNKLDVIFKQAREKVKLSDDVCEVLQEHWFEEYINKDSILNSYSLDNIK